MDAPPRKLPEAILIAGLPFLGYAYAFAYEYGYLAHYHLPYWLIHLSLVQVIVTMAAIGLAYMYALSTVGTLPAGPWYGFLAITFELLVASMVIVFSSRMMNWHRWPVRIIGGAFESYLLLYVVRLVVWRIVKPIRNGEGTVLERLMADRQKIRRTTYDLHDRVVNSTSPLGVTPAMHVWGWVIFGVMPVVVMFIGGWTATLQHELEVTVGPQPCAVLRAYTDEIICAPFDSATHKMSRNFSVIVPSGAAPITYRREWFDQVSLSPDPVADSIQARTFPSAR